MKINVCELNRAEGFMEYIGTVISDKKLVGGENEIVIFGAGDMLVGLLDDFCRLHINGRVACICDNASERTGGRINGIPVVSAEYAFRTFRDADYVVYNRYSGEICRQLMDNGIERIHLIRR